MLKNWNINLRVIGSIECFGWQNGQRSIFDRPPQQQDGKRIRGEVSWKGENWEYRVIIQKRTDESLNLTSGNKSGERIDSCKIYNNW